jgi:hypothetical protein
MRHASRGADDASSPTSRAFDALSPAAKVASATAHVAPSLRIQLRGATNQRIRIPVPRIEARQVLERGRVAGIERDRPRKRRAGGAQRAAVDRVAVKDRLAKTEPCLHVLGRGGGCRAKVLFRRLRRARVELGVAEHEETLDRREPVREPARGDGHGGGVERLDVGRFRERGAQTRVRAPERRIGADGGSIVQDRRIEPPFTKLSFARDE